MGNKPAIIVRELGIAVAVLAIYVLTLLLPLHQAAGLQRDLARLGFATADTWSVCQSLAADEDGDDRQAPQAGKCAANGIGKNPLGAAPAVLASLYPPAPLLPLAAPRVRTLPHLARYERQAIPRAPPVTV